MIVAIVSNQNHLSKGGRKIWTGKEGGKTDSVQVQVSY